MTPPEKILRQPEKHSLNVTWGEGQSVDLPYRMLREACGCARCVHEITGQRLLDTAAIPADIHVQEMKLVGNYAVRLSWSDGHDTGLYTWDRLAELSELSGEPGPPSPPHPAS